MESMATRNEQLHVKLKWLLKLRDMSQSQLAREATALASDTDAGKVSPQAVNRYLDGAVPSPDVALRLARVLKVDPVWLVDENQSFAVDDAAGMMGLIPGPYAFAYQHADEIDNDRLREVLGKRYVEVALPAHDFVERIQRIDWRAIAEKIEACGEIANGTVAEAAASIAVDFALLLETLVDEFGWQMTRGLYGSRAAAAMKAEPDVGLGQEIGYIVLAGRYHNAVAPIQGTPAGTAVHRWSMSGRRDRPLSPKAHLDKLAEAFERYEQAGGTFIEPSSD